MIDLTPIKARLAAATPGPWRISGMNYGDLVTVADIRFIAAARADVEALVAEVERLRSRFSMANAKPLKFEPFPGEFEDDGA